jgi:hypothetical protein
VQVLYLKTDIPKQEVKAILSLKPHSQKVEIGSLPTMTFSQTTESSEEVVAGKEKSKPSQTRFFREIKVDGILVLRETIIDSVDESDARSEVSDYKQFFANGKPSIEEVRTTSTNPRGVDSVKAEGIIWDEAGKKTKYRE